MVEEIKNGGRGGMEKKFKVDEDGGGLEFWMLCSICSAQRLSETWGVDIYSGVVTLYEVFR